MFVVLVVVELLVGVVELFVVLVPPAAVSLYRSQGDVKARVLVTSAFEHSIRTDKNSNIIFYFYNLQLI